MAVTGPGRIEDAGGVWIVAEYKQLNTNVPVHFGGNLTVDGTLTFSGAVSDVAPVTVTGANAAALAVGAAGATNPAFQVDTSETNQATGLLVEGFAAGSGVNLEVLSSGNNENLDIESKGSGTISLNTTIGTGGITLGTRTSAPAGITATIPVAGNVTGLTVAQNDTTNSPNAITVTQTTAGNGLSITQSGVNANTANLLFLTRSSNVTPASNQAAFQFTDSVASAATPCIQINDSNTNNNWSSFTVNSARTGQAIQLLHTGTGHGINVTANTVAANNGVLVTANGLTTGAGVNVASTSTAGTGSGSSFMVKVARSGANANASHTAVGVSSAVTNTGTTSTNIAAQLSASGATNNFALIARSLTAAIIGNTLTTVGTQNATLTAAQLLGGVIEHAVTTGAGTDTTDTGTNLSNAVPGVTVGDTFTTVLVNTSGSAFAITLAGGSGVTLKGSATTVAQNKTAYLLFINTGANTWNCYVTVSA